MTCTVCGKTIGYDEKFIQTPENETLCMDTACHMAYMLEHITMAEIAECFYGAIWKVELERARQGGLKGLAAEDKEVLLEWYMSGDFYTCDNDEPDEGYSAYDAADLEYNSRREDEILNRPGGEVAA